MTLLSIVQQASTRLGLLPPQAAFTSPDQTTQQIVAFAQDAGDDLRERWTWRILKSPDTTFTGDGTTTLFDLPDDFAVLSPSDTFVSSVYPTLTLPGPVNEDVLLRLKAVPVAVMPSCWRLIGNQIEFFPALAAGEIATYVYATAPWIKTQAGSRVLAWTADTDISLIPERLVRLGTIWMWKRSKGLDYAEEFASYERAFDLLAGQENTEREISTTFTAEQDDTWFPGTISYTGP